MTDPKQQVTAYAYAADDSVMGMTFSNATIATPSVSYTYDPVYNRVATMVDGTGTTTYTYHPSGSLGAGQVASVDGSLTDDTITYTYDELGRVVSRAINGAANTTTQVYDALGRVTSETNVLGAFTYAYVGATGRLQLVTYPNGQTSAYAYYDNLNDQRLQTIHHRKPDNSTLSKFDYTYDVAGNILTWQQQADSDAPTLWTYGYDRADQLTAAIQQTTGTTPSIIKRYAYTYDPAGNRTSEQIDDAVTLATHDSLNRLLTHAPGGALVFKGGLNEPGRVTINGVPAATTAANQFQAAVPLSSGTNTVTINAVDASGNATEAVYEVDQAGPTKTFTYDANGNMTSDGTRTFEWDARNQLVAVTVGTHRTEFAYDGLQRRVRETVRDNGIVVDGATIQWCSTLICEIRPLSELSPIARTFELGEARGEETRLYYFRDHLTSVRDVTDSSGGIVYRAAFDPSGRPHVAPSLDVVQVGFTGHRQFQQTPLVLSQFRMLDTDTGRWLSEDPLGIRSSLNLYAYVENRTVSRYDPLGLQSVTPVRCNAAQSEQLRGAFSRICSAVNSDGGCRRVLSSMGAQSCMTQQCRTGVRVECTCPQWGCGSRGSGGTMGITPMGFDGGKSCGGRDRPSDGPSHTLAHEMAHCKIGPDFDADHSPSHAANWRMAEQAAYACREMR